MTMIGYRPSVMFPARQQAQNSVHFAAKGKRVRTVQVPQTQAPEPRTTIQSSREIKKPRDIWELIEAGSVPDSTVLNRIPVDTLKKPFKSKDLPTGANLATHVLLHFTKLEELERKHRRRIRSEEHNKLYGEQERLHDFLLKLYQRVGADSFLDSACVLRVREGLPGEKHGKSADYKQLHPVVMEETIKVLREVRAKTSQVRSSLKIRRGKIKRATDQQSAKLIAEFCDAIEAGINRPKTPSQSPHMVAVDYDPPTSEDGSVNGESGNEETGNEETANKTANTGTGKGLFSLSDLPNIPYLSTLSSWLGGGAKVAAPADGPKSTTASLRSKSSDSLHYASAEEGAPATKERTTAQRTSKTKAASLSSHSSTSLSFVDAEGALSSSPASKDLAANPFAALDGKQDGATGYSRWEAAPATNRKERKRLARQAKLAEREKQRLADEETAKEAARLKDTRPINPYSTYVPEADRQRMSERGKVALNAKTKQLKRAQETVALLRAQLEQQQKGTQFLHGTVKQLHLDKQIAGIGKKAALADKNAAVTKQSELQGRIAELEQQILELQSTGLGSEDNTLYDGVDLRRPDSRTQIWVGHAANDTQGQQLVDVATDSHTEPERKLSARDRSKSMDDLKFDTDEFDSEGELIRAETSLPISGVKHDPAKIRKKGSLDEGNFLSRIDGKREPFKPFNSAAKNVNLLSKYLNLTR